MEVEVICKLINQYPVRPVPIQKVFVDENYVIIHHVDTHNKQFVDVRKTDETCQILYCYRPTRSIRF